MKRFHLVIGLMATMLMTKQAKALNEYVAWTALEQVYATGYLPRVAMDELYGVAGIFESGTGFSTVLYETGNNQKITDPPNPTGLGSTLWNPDSTINGEVGHAAGIALAWGNGYDTAIEVHQGGQDGGGALWYTMATTKLSKTFQIPATLHWGASSQYDTGFNPTVAVDNSSYPGAPGVEQVVEIHQATSSTSDLWYHVGWLENPDSASPTFVWGPSYQFDKGYAPIVSTANGLVVEAHQGASGKLWYSLGTAAFFQITWSPGVNYAIGYNPSISVFGCASCGGWTVVEVHQAFNGTGPLEMKIGSVKSITDTKITWSSNTQYEPSGCYPSIAQNAAYLVEVHSTECAKAANLVYSFGYFYFM